MIDKQVPANWLEVPTSTGWLDVGDTHVIRWTSFGSADKTPVIALHGGPGSGSDPRHLCFFDPLVHRVVMFDQRGSGESTPSGSTSDNTTHDLIADIERLRHDLGIERWLVFGVSWGACLATLYAQTHAPACTGLALAGLSNRHIHQTHWILEARPRLLPERHSAFLAPLDPAERADPIAAYYRMSQSTQRADQLEATYAVWVLEDGLEQAVPETLRKPAPDEIDEATIRRARIYLHYWAHRTFLPDGQLLIDPAVLARMPVVMIHGEFDWVCPLSGARLIADAISSAKLIVVPDAGHSAYQATMVDALREAITALSVQR